MTPSPSDSTPEILNEGFEFNREAPLHVRTRFAGIAQKTLLSEGTPLYRFVEGNLGEAEHDFWLPLETYHRLYRADFVPAWAIWNNGHFPAQTPTSFWIATLTRRVYGFKGLAAAAGNTAITWESLISGGLVWIPGLSSEHFYLKVYGMGFR